jgi:hypothetical protein
VHWRRDAPIETITSPAIGTVHGPKPHRTGDHHAECVFYAVGPTVRSGGINHPFSVMDFPATIGELLGVKLEGLNGAIIPELAPQERRGAGAEPRYAAPTPRVA